MLNMRPLRNQLFRFSVASAARFCVLARQDSFVTGTLRFDKWRSGNWEAWVGYALRIVEPLFLVAPSGRDYDLLLVCSW